MKNFDTAIIGGGASGIMCARTILARGKSVVIIDAGDRLLRKVLASGGGRCNFTNLNIDIARYHGENQAFARSSLSRFTPQDMIDYVESHGISWYEKTDGQLFCEKSSALLVDALIKDIKGAEVMLNTPATSVIQDGDGFVINNEIRAGKIVIATGGLSFPGLNVSDFGLKIAAEFGHKIVPTAPALVGISTSAFPDLAGISTPVKITIDKKSVTGQMLFTHKGISGPVVFNASLLSPWTNFEIDFLPGYSIAKFLKNNRSKKTLAEIVGTKLPQRLAKFLCEIAPETATNEISDAEFDRLENHISHFVVANATLQPFDRAEVTRGGVSTEKISSKTFESLVVPGLYFTGEVLDITGDLGGFNLHFAFASGVAAGNAV